MGTVTLWLPRNVNSGGRYISRHTVCTVGSCGNRIHQMPDGCVLCDKQSPRYKQIRARVLPSVNVQSRRGDRRAASTCVVTHERAQRGNDTGREWSRWVTCSEWRWGRHTRMSVRTPGRAPSLPQDCLLVVLSDLLSFPVRVLIRAGALCWSLPELSRER